MNRTHPLHLRALTVLAVCALATTLLLPRPVVAGADPIADAINHCLLNKASDQATLAGKLQAEGWRKVESAAALSSLSYLIGLEALMVYELTSTPDTIAEGKEVINAALRNAPEAMFASYRSVGLFTHPDLGATLLRTNGSKGRQFCRMALGPRAYAGGYLEQLRIVIELKNAEQSYEMEETTHAGGPDTVSYTLKANINTTVNDDGTSRPGPILGKGRIRQITPTKDSRAAFEDLFDASGYLSTRLIARK